MTENTTQSAECLSHLTDELDTTSDESDLMEVFVDGTEISHYLMGHINDIGNLEPWQKTVCNLGAVTIDRLRDEIKRLRLYEKRLLWLSSFISDSSNEILLDVFGESCASTHVIQIIDEQME